MTRDERIEAAAEALYEARNSYTPGYVRLTTGYEPRPWAEVPDRIKASWRRLAIPTIDAAYPEIAAGTHWIAPREMTESMAAAGTIAMTLDIERRSGPLPPDTPENAFSRGLIVGGCSRSSIEVSAAWSAARDAYLKQEGEKP